MRARSIKVGGTYLVRWSLDKIPRDCGGNWPYIAGWSEGKVTEKLDQRSGPYAQFRVEFPAWRWDYENRPEGWSETRWMVDEKSNKKKVYCPQAKTVNARQIREVPS